MGWLEGVGRLDGCSIFVGQSIDLTPFGHRTRLAASPLLVPVGERGAAVLFRYGVVVLFGLPAEARESWLRDVWPHVIDPFVTPLEEEFVLEVVPDEPEGLEQECIRVRALTVQKLQVVADVLAKNTVLAHYESALTEQFDRIEPLAATLSKGQYRGPKGRHLIQHIGDTLAIEAKMIARLEITEKPDLIWDYPEYERLYLRLQDGYELPERYAAIVQKLALISKTAQTLLDLIQNARSLRVEWYIVILIVADIVIAMLAKAV